METEYFNSHSFGGTANGDWSVVGAQCKVGDQGQYVYNGDAQPGEQEIKPCVIG